MIVETFESTEPNKYVDLGEIALRVKKSFSSDDVNKMTLRLQTIFHCVNHPGNRHDISKRCERNPCFHTDGNGKFRLLTDSEIKKFKKSF